MNKKKSIGNHRHRNFFFSFLILEFRLLLCGPPPPPGVGGNRQLVTVPPRVRGGAGHGAGEYNQFVVTSAHNVCVVGRGLGAKNNRGSDLCPLPGWFWSKGTPRALELVKTRPPLPSKNKDRHYHTDVCASCGYD